LAKVRLATRNTRMYRRRLKSKLIAYKGGKCEICGYSKLCNGAYAFHHREPKQKDFAVGRSYCLGFRRCCKEVDKCMLVCVRCHAELHEEECIKSHGPEAQ
jgi:hypothetical protein